MSSASWEADSNHPIITRFAPSPTGYLHLGGLRTAIFAWAFARRHSGEFILRIEDTDGARNQRAAAEAIIEAMEWMGLDYDREIIWQSDNRDRHLQVVNSLLENKQAYRCRCSAERLASLRERQMLAGEQVAYDRTCRDLAEPVSSDEEHVVRLAMPKSGYSSYHDEVYGEVRVENAQLDDWVLLRTNGTPTYNLAAAVDDIDSQITHVLRGEDHLTNSHRQLRLYQLLEAKIPSFAHVPLILRGQTEPDSEQITYSRMSKRHGAVDVLEYKRQGYLPEALFSYLLRLGFAFGDEEIISKQRCLEIFCLERLQKSPARFDLEKLNWMNRHYLRSIPLESLQVQVASMGTEQLTLVDEYGLDILRQRDVNTLQDLNQMANEILDSQDFVQDTWEKYQQLEVQNTNWRVLFKELVDSLQDIADSNSIAAAKPLQVEDVDQLLAKLRQAGKAENIKPAVLMRLLRLALYNQLVGLDVNLILQLLGAKQAVARIESFINSVDAYLSQQ